MSYGFSCLNASGYAQIDDTYSNTYVIASGSQLATASGTALSITPPIGFTDPYIILVSPNTNNIPVWVYGNLLFATSTITVDVVLLAFNSADSIPTDYGFIVYRTDGLPAFVADRKTGNVQARRQLTLAESNAYTTVYTIAIPDNPVSGKKRYFSLNSCAIDYQQQFTYPSTGNGLFGRSLSFSSINSLTISASIRYTALPPASSNVYQTYPSKRQYLIVDF